MSSGLISLEVVVSRLVLKRLCFGVVCEKIKLQPRARPKNDLIKPNTTRRIYCNFAAVLLTFETSYLRVELMTDG